MSYIGPFDTFWFAAGIAVSCLIFFISFVVAGLIWGKRPLTEEEIRGLSDAEIIRIYITNIDDIDPHWPLLAPHGSAIWTYLTMQRSEVERWLRKGNRP